MRPGLRQARPASLLALGMLLGAASVSGCAQNAIFELTLDLPPRPASLPASTPMYAFPQLRSGTSEAFTDRWAGQDPLTGVELTAERTEMKISVIGNSDIEARSVRLKTQFCVDPRCNGFGDDSMAPISCVQFERVFYVGTFTSYRLTHIDVVPTIVTCGMSDVFPVGRCDVRGCVDGDTTSYCRLEDGTHFCE